MIYAILKTYHRRPWIALVIGLGLAGLTECRTSLAQDTSTIEAAQEHLILVVGAAGEDEYAAEFSTWSQAWQSLASQRQWNLTRIDQHTSANAQREALMASILEHGRSAERLWIVLLGHGTYSGAAAKFNLVGPDVAAQELSTWLKRVECPLVVINCSSASGPFLPELSGQERVVLTGTRSGSEINFARFGKYLSQSLNDLAADVDHDLEVSLLEAFLAATAGTERFYREEARLTTEHALLDDNGDRAGTSGDFFRGVRPVKKANAGAAIDGDVAKRIILYSAPDAPKFSPELAKQRSTIEDHIDALRSQKSELTETDYLAELQRLMLQLSNVYSAAEAL